MSSSSSRGVGAGAAVVRCGWVVAVVVVVFFTAGVEVGALEAGVLA